MKDIKAFFQTDRLEDLSRDEKAAMSANPFFTPDPILFRPMSFVFIGYLEARSSGNEEKAARLLREAKDIQDMSR